MTATEEYTPFGDNPPPRELTELRLRAESLARAEDDDGLVSLVDELRGDSELWPHLWGPAAAIAASRLGRGGALDLLRSAVDGGFSQPELFEGKLEEQFSADEGWAEIEARMAANVPPAKITLLDWPVADPSVPLEFYTIAEQRQEDLRRRLPDPQPSAWETAQALLTWTRRQWEHANDHVEDPDALDVLDRVESGERFACVEYSIVLSQALNAVGIPGRRLDLRQRNHHVGVGRGHVVSEAWIDDLDRWVVVDGQNGAYWVDADGLVLGARELQRALREGGPCRMVGLVDEMSEGDSATWLGYFASISTTGGLWADHGFTPVFQDMGVIKSTRILDQPEPFYPRLSGVTIGFGGTLAEPVLRLSTDHPYARGFRVVVDGAAPTDVAADASGWSLDMTAGRHEVEISVLTDYGSCAPQRVVYEIR